MSSVLSSHKKLSVRSAYFPAFISTFYCLSEYPSYSYEWVFPQKARNLRSFIYKKSLSDHNDFRRIPCRIKFNSSMSLNTMTCLRNRNNNKEFHIWYDNGWLRCVSEVRGYFQSCEIICRKWLKSTKRFQCFVKFESSRFILLTFTVWNSLLFAFPKLFPSSLSWRPFSKESRDRFRLAKLWRLLSSLTI